jgi:hypothetical protein
MLGIAYNFFDGEEILEQSVKSVRPYANYIVLVYQETSNYGHPITKKALKLLNKLHTQGLVDQLVKYMPARQGNGGAQETRKRNIGVQLCRQAGCTHYLSMDADELYTKQFAIAKDQVMAGNYDLSFCLYYDYYKLPTYRVRDKRGMLAPQQNQRTSVTFITKLRESTVHQFGAYNSIRWFKPLVDPTRMILPLTKNIKLFEPRELMMHHMSWVRKDITSKVMNSSARENDRYVKQAEAIKKGYDTWKPGVTLPFAPRKVDIIPVEDQFSIGSWEK